MSTGAAVSEAPELQFRGSDRFTLEREIGSGGMGVVYQAYDQERHVWVALKTLRRLDSDAIYRFKREFRALTDVRHQNLVELYELFEEAGHWFFTMELVDGEEILDFLNFADPDSQLTSAYLPAVTDQKPVPACDPERARGAFLSVAEALCELHRAGKLHRDLKPENVMITREGRVVVLDFGLAMNLDDGPRDTVEPMLVGTPEYMAPEQVAGDSLTEAADWYAFGVMLYEVLTGDVPYADEPRGKLLLHKIQRDPRPPSDVLSRVPPDLDELCLRLLDRDPARRPTGAQIVEVLSRGLRSSFPAESTTGDVPKLPFVGRLPELAMLEAAVDRAAHGRPVVALLHGHSGIGKTTLAEHFLRRRREAPSSVVLSGRCYEHESLAFKAFDSIVDALARFLGRLEPVQVRAYMPRRLAALLTVFPMLGRVEALREARRKRRFTMPADPMEIRRQAFQAFRELLGRIAEDKELVVHIDDMQWGDVDSVQLIESIIAADEPPPFLLLCSYRSEDLERSPCLTALMELHKRQPSIEFQEIALGPLEPAEARALTNQLLGDGSDLDATSLATESQGSPYLLTELVRFAKRAGASSGQAQTVTITSALARRIDSLSADARDLLTLLCVAGRPLTRDVYGLVRQHDVDIQGALFELRGENLVRSSGRNALTPYHDRIRETLVAHLPQSQRALWHGRLARVLEAGSDVDERQVAYHFFEACEPQKGADYAILGAAKAVEELAFGHAANLYQLAVERGAFGADRRRELLVSLAQVLELSGRRVEAASTFTWAAADAPPDEARRLRRRSGEALVLSGHSDMGLALLEDAMQEYGIEVHPDDRSALTAYYQLWEETKERGLQWTPRAEADVQQSVRDRLDTLWAAGFGLGRIEGVRVHAQALRYTVEALKGGDRYQAVRGLCFHYAFMDLPTSQIMNHEPLPALELATRLTREVSDPRCEAWLMLARGMEKWLAGLADSTDLLECARELFLNGCVGSTPERGLCTSMIIHDLVLGNRWSELHQRGGEWYADAVVRDDRTLMHATGLGAFHAALCRSQLERARELLVKVEETSRHVRFEVRFAIELARSELMVIDNNRPGMQRYVELVDEYLLTSEGALPRWRVPALLRRAACNIRLGMDDGDERLFAQADEDVARAARHELPRQKPVLLLTRAALACCRGDRDQARTLVAAIFDLDHELEDDQRTFFRFCEGIVMDGPTGADQLEQTTSALAQQGVTSPDLIVEAFYPGLLGQQRPAGRPLL